MTLQRPDDVLTNLSRALREAGVEHVLMGGYAVVVWGVPRATYDVDVLIDADERALDRCLQRLEATGEPVLQRQRHRAGDRGDAVGQEALQARLDIERRNHLRADPGRQRVDDLGVVEGVACKRGEPIGLERHLVRPHGDGGDEDRERGEQEQLASVGEGAKDVKAKGPDDRR